MSSKEWMVVGLGEVGVMHKGEGELGIVCKILKILNKRKKEKEAPRCAMQPQGGRRKMRKSNNNNNSNTQKNNPIGRDGSGSPWATKSLTLRNKFSWLREQGS